MALPLRRSLINKMRSGRYWEISSCWFGRKFSSMKWMSSSGKIHRAVTMCGGDRDCGWPVRPKISHMGHDENFPQTSAEYIPSLMTLAKVRSPSDRTGWRHLRIGNLQVSPHTLRTNFQEEWWLIPTLKLKMMGYLKAGLRSLSNTWWLLPCKWLWGIMWDPPALARGLYSPLLVTHNQKKSSVLKYNAETETSFIPLSFLPTQSQCRGPLAQLLQGWPLLALCQTNLQKS